MEVDHNSEPLLDAAVGRSSPDTVLATESAAPQAKICTFLTTIAARRMSKETVREPTLVECPDSPSKNDTPHKDKRKWFHSLGSRRMAAINPSNSGKMATCP
jgi:hypothetical protein